MQTWKWPIKVGLVVGGYVLAVVITVLATAAYIATEPPDAQSAQGMYAFGEMLFSMAVFGLAVIVPSGLALYFLRPFEKLWAVFSILVVVFAIFAPSRRSRLTLAGAAAIELVVSIVLAGFMIYNLGLTNG